MDLTTHTAVMITKQKLHNVENKTYIFCITQSSIVGSNNIPRTAVKKNLLIWRIKKNKP